MKRLISLMLALCMVSISIVSASANETHTSAEDTDIVTERELMDIPFFFVTSETHSALTENQKKQAADTIANYCDGAVMSLSNNPDYSISPLSKTQKENVLRSPVYKSTIARIQEVINGGATVKYINLYSKDPQIVNGQRAADLNDPAYWESNYESFGTYNGYKFLYVESSAGVETNEVEPGNISGTLKWDAIMKKTLAFDYFVKDSYFKAAKKISGKLSSWLNYYKAPLTISYSPSRDYVKAKVSGDLYIRTVLIQDKLNRVNGYAYYDWGTAEMFAAALRIDGKYPKSQNSSGTYMYEYPSYTFPTQKQSTPGYPGNETIRKSIINLYTNTSGFFTHDEGIDVNSAVASLLS